MLSNIIGKKAYGLAVILVISVLLSRIFKNKQELTVSIVGDIMLSRDVAYYLDRFGYDYPYEEVSGIFRNDDLTIGNLECPITEADNPADKTKRFIFKADPENAAALSDAGFDCLVLANNHTMDYLARGLRDTMTELEKYGLAHVGAINDQASEGSYVFNKYGIGIGILAYSALPPEGFFYNGDEPTVKYINSIDLSRLERDIASINLICDFTIVYFHWGNEYLPYNSEAQEIIAKGAIDYGADFVVGAHPHVLQNTDVYKGKYIYYSLGNFIFDKQIPPATDEGIIIQLIINEDGLKGINEIPVKIKDAKPMLE